MSDSPHVFIVNENNFVDVVIEGSHRVPVLVDFWADWCAPCRMLMPILSQLADAYGGRFLLAKVNTDEQQALAARYGVRSLPTVKLFMHGAPVDEFMGALPESAVREFLDRHLPRQSDAILDNAIRAYEMGDAEQSIALLQIALGDDPDNVRIHAHLARILMTSGRIAEATKVLNAVPTRHATEPEILALKDQLEFAEIASTAPPDRELERLIESDPGNCQARYELSARHILGGRYEQALQLLLDIMKRDRGFRDDAGRKGMLTIFGLLGGGELVNRYRSKMSSALY